MNCIDPAVEELLIFEHPKPMPPSAVVKDVPEYAVGMSETAIVIVPDEEPPPDSPDVTVTAHVSFLVLSTVDVAVIVAEPAATAVTKPVFETVATLVLLDDQLTVWAAPPLTLTVAVNWPVVLEPDVLNDKALGETDTKSTDEVVDEPLIDLVDQLHVFVVVPQMHSAKSG